jgi:hypothetical protein
MRDAAFRQFQRDRRTDPHIAPINQLVARLQGYDGRGWLPEVAPMHGGVDARILSVLRDPGPMTREGSGSGFLCVENDDPTAETQCGLVAIHTPGGIEKAILDFSEMALTCAVSGRADRI